MRLSEQFRARMFHSLFLKSFEKCGGRPVKIVEWQRRIAVGLPPEEPSHISPVLQHQSVGVVLRMSLEEDKQAIVLLNESIYARRAPAQHAIPATSQCKLRNPIPTRVRKLE